MFKNNKFRENSVHIGPNVQFGNVSHNLRWPDLGMSESKLRLALHGQWLI